jgi:hypothetical protein
MGGVKPVALPIALGLKALIPKDAAESIGVDVHRLNRSDEERKDGSPFRLRICKPWKYLDAFPPVI